LDTSQHSDAGQFRAPAGSGVVPDSLEDVGRLSVRLLMQATVEAEVEAFLSRARYVRRDEDSPAGYRNGSQPLGALVEWLFRGWGMPVGPSPGANVTSTARRSSHESHQSK
jgi:hypothetical protein